MKRTAFDERRDQRIADESTVDRHLMCAADHCPRRWSVQRGGEKGLCSAHAWADPNKWPQVTQDLHDIDLHRARNFEQPPVKTGTREEALAALKKLRIGNPDMKAWARQLESRDMSGERLSPIQVKAYQEALR